MNKLIIAALILSLATNTYVLLKPKEITIEESEPEKIVVTEKEVVTIADDEYRNKYEQVLNKLAVTEEELNRVQSELDIFLERQALNKLKSDIEKDVEEKVASGKFEMTDDFAKKQEEKRKSVIDLFAKESVEASWAYQTQDNIKQALIEMGDSDSYEIEDLICKTSICRLKFNPYKQGQGARNMAMMNATMAITMGDSVKGMQMSGGEHLTDNEQNSVLIYLSKRED